MGKKSLTKVVDGLFTSKITYGLQLFGKVRINSEDITIGDLGAIQKVQNKMARFLNFKTLKDKFPTIDLLTSANLLSVNQLNLKIKIQEAWKSINVDRYPLKLECQEPSSNTTSTRAMTSGRLIEVGKSNLSFNTCISDVIRLWNSAPEELKKCESLQQLKKAAKLYAKTFPV